MKKLLSLLVVALLAFSALPVIMAAGGGGSLGGGIGVQPFVPVVWQCDERVLLDDEEQPWRTSGLDDDLIERNQQYLFEGEEYQVDVVVMDKNKIEDVRTDLLLGEEAGDDDALRINCIPITIGTDQFADCNARVPGQEYDDGETEDWDASTMQAYRCIFTVADSEHMYGPFWMSVEATGENEKVGIYAEVARWFINPMISLNVEGALDFEEVLPGTSSYSTILLENTAEGGVLLDMFITGKDWPAVDPTDSGRCANVDGTTGVADPTDLKNYLSLGAFRYYAENGMYSTRDDAEDDNTYSSITRDCDAEGYCNINYQINDGFEEDMFNDAEIIQANAFPTGGVDGYYANLLYPNSVGMSVTFRLNLPEPCYGEFEAAQEEGQEPASIFFWGEAI